MSRPVIAIFDDFFEQPDQAFNDIVARGNFEDYISPWDGVRYPGINAKLSGWDSVIIKAKLRRLLGREVMINALFARLTTEHTPVAPHKIHSDRIMGQYSLHVYLSKEWPDFSGTSFWCHKTEGIRHTEKTDIAAIQRDQNQPEGGQWKEELFCPGKFNRALIHDAALWHCAEPVGGWGKSRFDGRVVLTCFFSEVVK